MKSLHDVLTENGVQLTKSGERYKARCPFHEGDNEPSFTVYNSETYYCFGCEVWGDAVKFLVDYKGMSAKDALEYVGSEYKQPKADKKQVIKMANSSKTWRFVYEVALQYHDNLLKSVGPQNYLLRRGLTIDTMRKYKLGYTDGRVLNLKYAEDYELATEVGILTKTGYELLSHRITVPSIIEGTVLADFIIGRTVINDNVKYLGARMPKPLLGFSEVSASPVIFLVEGQFDWLTLRQWGYPAVCIGGTHLRDHMVLPLTGKTLVIVPDYDDTVGQSAAQVLFNRFSSTRYNGAYILDYSALRKGDSKLDVSTLAEWEQEEAFNQIVRDKLPWLSSLSSKTLMTWFPNLDNLTKLA